MLPHDLMMMELAAQEQALQQQALQEQMLMGGPLMSMLPQGPPVMMHPGFPVHGWTDGPPVGMDPFGMHAGRRRVRFDTDSRTDSRFDRSTSMPPPRRGHGGMRRHPDRGIFGGMNGMGDGFGGCRLRRGDEQVSVPGFSLVKSLSPGGMSEAVNLVKDQKTGKLFIEKRVRISNRHLKKRAQAELWALQRIERGRNLNYVIKFLWQGNAGFCSFILEYFELGSLDSKIHDYAKKGKKFAETFIWHTCITASATLRRIPHTSTETPCATST